MQLYKIGSMFSQFDELKKVSGKLRIQEILSNFQTDELHKCEYSSKEQNLGLKRHLISKNFYLWHYLINTHSVKYLKIHISDDPRECEIMHFSYGL